MTRKPKAEDQALTEGALLLSAFRKAADVLGLTRLEQVAILGVSVCTIKNWKMVPEAGPDELDWMAMFVGIFGLAGQAFPGERGAEGWLRRQNLAPMFGGEAPLDLILAGRLEALRQTGSRLRLLPITHCCRWQPG